MIGKIGFILLVLLFGALAFVAGMLAPPSFKAPVEALEQQAAAYLPQLKREAPALSKSAAGAEAGAPAGAAAQPAKPPPAPAENKTP